MFTFFRAAYENLAQTGSLVESSSRLAGRMTRIVDFSRSVHIVELGAGTGSITRHLLDQINAVSRLTSFEINPQLFYKLHLLKRPQFAAVNDDVCQLPRYIAPETADYVISGLPLANLNRSTKEHILEAVKSVLKPGGFYIQFQYSLNDRALLRRKFPLVQLGFEPINIPPAFIYYAQRQ
ncbi:class I SAM-dependent methyltransferase [Niabella drilacis]|uniref:Phospholipid N-methyltransferase n=1 Tax=Niabella drilacis (strain DSM 25811 / CCM 8410 / CCUG 62505 / LMG 26954 / E90) TaxID=1285928 RepID=A0A1G6TRS9_NIADE|nr:methyltransferase domain-containing protein [Niabella drilacis]SDD31741.1 Phospholipid N-methyltransferase [Niabella drilacis]